MGYFKYFNKISALAKCNTCHYRQSRPWGYYCPLSERYMGDYVRPSSAVFIATLVRFIQLSPPYLPPLQCAYSVAVPVFTITLIQYHNLVWQYLPPVSANFKQRQMLPLLSVLLIFCSGMYHHISIVLLESSLCTDLTFSLT